MNDAPFRLASPALLFDFLTAIAAATTRDALWAVASTRLKWILDFERLDIAELNDDGQSYALHTAFESRPGVPRILEPAVPIDAGVAGRFLTRDERCMIPDVAPDPVTAPPDEWLEAGSLPALLAVRMEYEGNTLGALVFGTARKAAYDHFDVETACTVAVHLAAALVRTRYARRVQTALAESVPQLVWMTRADGGVEYFNERWYAYTGSTSAESHGDGWSQFLHPDDRADTWRRWQDALRAGAPVEAEYRLRGADGTYQWFLARGVPMKDERGDVERWFGTCTNVDAQKRLAVDLEAANRAKDELLAMLGHELRNPLAAVRAAVGVLGTLDGADERTGRARSVLERQVRQLSRLVDDILDVSRLETGRISLDVHPVDLRRIAEQALHVFQQTGRTREHDVVLEGPGVRVLADATRIAQVVDNLVDNALKYTPAGGTIAIVTERDGDRGLLRVRDTGVGIAADLLPRVFDTFVQADRSVDRSRGGLGLGLALVRRLAELHGGAVSASSGGPGQGTEFVVALPLAAPDAIAAAAAAGGPRAAAATSASSAARRVLVVEDNADVREMLRLALTLAGHEVYEAPDGPEGVQAALALKPDVALVDVGLPALDGYAVAARIRASEDGGRICLIALTGYGQAEDRLRARDAGFDEHLVKPVDPDHLAEVVRSARRGGPSRR